MLKVSSFPSMPAAAVKLMAILDQKDIAIDEITRIMQYDPGLTGNVLNLRTLLISAFLRKSDL